jgi:hypothetical protein
MYYRHRAGKEKKRRRKRRKSFFPAAFFFVLFVSAYNHLSALCVDEEEGKKEKNECNFIVKLSAV